MLTRIVHNSGKLCAFIDQLDLNLTEPPYQHLLNLADFLRISPWQAEEVRRALRLSK